MFHFEFPPQFDEALMVKRYLNRQAQRLADGLDLLAATAGDDGVLARYAAINSGLTDYFPCSQDYSDVAQFANEEFIDPSPMNGSLATFSDRDFGVNGALLLPGNGCANFSVKVSGIGAQSVAVEVSARAGAMLESVCAATSTGH